MCLEDDWKLASMLAEELSCCNCFGLKSVDELCHSSNGTLTNVSHISGQQASVTYYYSGCPYPTAGWCGHRLFAHGGFFKHNPNCFQITQPGRGTVTPPYKWRRRHIITACSFIYNPDVNVPGCYTVKQVSDFTVYFLCFLVWVFQDVFLSSENSHHCCSTMRKIREILDPWKKLQQFLVYT